MSPALTFLSNMSDTTYDHFYASSHFGVRKIWSRSHMNDVSVRETDAKPELLIATHSWCSIPRVCCTASEHRQLRITAVKLLEESENVSSVAQTAWLRSENKWFVLLFHAVTARLARQANAMLCGSRLC